MGDQTRMVIMDAVIREVFGRNLFDVVKESGKVLLSGLEEIQVMIETGSLSLQIDV